jgi:hypothetical protein
MSQADSPNTTATSIAAPRASRRGLLMGFAALATPSAPALASRVLGLPTVPVVDPIFAVIAEHRKAQEVLHAACEANDRDMEDDPNKETAENRVYDAELPLFTTTPTTVAGAAALLTYVGSDAHEINQSGDGPNDRPHTVLSYAAGWLADDRIEAVRRFPVHVAAALRSMVGQQTRVVQPTEPDSIFAAIGRHRAAWKDLNCRCSDLADDPAPEAQAALAAIHEEVGAAVGDLNEIEPTTIAGAVALLRYAASQQEITETLGVTLHDPGVLADALEKISGYR